MSGGCCIEGCGRRKQSAAGYCDMHWKRNKRNGGPLVKLRARGVMDVAVTGRRVKPLKELPPRPLLSDKERAMLVRLVLVDILPMGEVEAMKGRMTIDRLRRKLGRDSILTIFRQGYQLSAEGRTIIEKLRGAA